MFVPFGVEIARGLGKEARAFYSQCLEWANEHTDVESCHWIVMSFRRHWNMRFGVLLCRELGRIGKTAAKGATTRAWRQLGITDTEPWRELTSSCRGLTAKTLCPNTSSPHV